MLLNNRFLRRVRDVAFVHFQLILETKAPSGQTLLWFLVWRSTGPATTKRVVTSPLHLWREGKKKQPPFFFLHYLPACLPAAAAVVL